MATYTNKSKQSTTLTKKLGVHDAWEYDRPDISYDDNVYYDSYKLVTAYTNASKSLGVKILWSEATDTWADYTESWDEMSLGTVISNAAKNASNFVNKARSTGTRNMLWSEATDTWADYTQSWAGMTIAGAGIVYTNKIPN